MCSASWRSGSGDGRQASPIEGAGRALRAWRCQALGGMNDDLRVLSDALRSVTSLVVKDAIDDIESLEELPAATRRSTVTGPAAVNDMPPQHSSRVHPAGNARLSRRKSALEAASAAAVRDPFRRNRHSRSTASQPKPTPSADGGRHPAVLLAPSRRGHDTLCACLTTCRRQCGLRSASRG
jgi:hypothetical protein